MNDCCLTKHTHTHTHIYIYIYIYEDGCCRSIERIGTYFENIDLYFLNLFILFLHMCYIHVCFQLVAFAREHVWHKAFLMGYSMRLELTLVSSINDHCLVRLVYIVVVVPLSWSVFTLVCLYIYIYIYIYICINK